MTHSPLFPYQIEGIDLIVNKYKDVLLADHPGAGKTCQAVIAADKLDARVIIVVCPASLRENWKREFKKWGSRNSSEYVLMVLSYEAATKRPDIPHEVVDLLILDEVHYLKNPESKRTKACLNYLWDMALKRIAITGTPLPNGRAIEAWPIFSKLCPQEFRDKWKFINTYCVKTVTPWGIHYNKSKNLEVLGLIARRDFMIRRERAQTIGQLPPLVRQTIALDIKYDELNYEAMFVDEKTGELSLEIKSEWRRLGIMKIQSAVEYILNLLEEVKNCVVFAHHIDVLDGLRLRLDSARVTNCTLRGDTFPAIRQQNVDDFQAGEYRVFLASLHAASTGITLTASCDVVFVECDWVPAINEQAEGRCLRVTQKNITRSHYLVVPDSLDERIVSAVIKKQACITKVMGD